MISHLKRNCLPNALRIFSVNCFLKNEEGKFLWPGFGQNIRVLKWIVDCVNGKAFAMESPLGWIPRYEDMDWTGMENFKREDFQKLMSVDHEA